MDQKSYERLNKLMMLTQSENDAEALAALRKANKILKENEWNWDKVFQKPTTLGFFTVDPSWAPAPRRPRQRYGLDDELCEEIEEAFETVVPTCKGSFLETIESIREQFNRSGSLSERQIEVLFNARERVLGKRKEKA